MKAKSSPEERHREREKAECHTTHIVAPSSPSHLHLNLYEHNGRQVSKEARHHFSLVVFLQGQGHDQSFPSPHDAHWMLDGRWEHFPLRKRHHISGQPSNLSVSVISYIGQFWLFRHLIGLPKCWNFVCIGRYTEILAEIARWAVSVSVFRQKTVSVDRYVTYIESWLFFPDISGY